MSTSASTLAHAPENIGDRTTFVLRQMTASQLQQLGVRRLAYAKVGRLDGRGAVYFVHAADGQLLAMLDNVNLALEFAIQNNLILVPVN
jgi:hypothetical protein